MHNEFTAPDVLVLGAGGVAGVAWLDGVLAGIEDSSGVDFRRADCFVGTSAGSIVAARLAAGRRPRRPRSEAGGEGAPAREGDHAEDRWSALASAAAPVLAPWLPLVLAIAAPGTALARRVLLAAVPRGERTHDQLAEDLNRLRSRFDGRLRVCTVDRRSGRRVVFGAPGAPDANVGEAVAASCAIPGQFVPVRIGRREYVDGGVWSPTNADVAVVARGTRVLLLNPLGSLGNGSPSGRALVGSAIRVAESIEATVLRGRGATVHSIVPDAACAAAMGADYMASRAALAVADVAYRQGLALGGA